jgi:hypothetical protein
MIGIFGPMGRALPDAEQRGERLAAQFTRSGRGYGSEDAEALKDQLATLSEARVTNPGSAAPPFPGE